MNRILDIQTIDFLEIKKRHKDTYYIPLYDLLQKNEDNAKGNLKIFYKKIKDELENVLIGTPDKLEDLNQTFLTIMSKMSGTQSKCLKKKLRKIFDYDDFVDSDLPKWGAYKFTQLLNINTCPYCNRQYITTFDRKDILREVKKLKIYKWKLITKVKGKTRPELDHFYSQNDFPYFRISLFNLIPSCHICNSNFKGKIKFNTGEYINPYFQSFHNILRFSVIPYKKKELSQKIKDGILDKEVNDYFGFELFNGNFNSFRIRLKPQKNRSFSTEDYVKAKNNDDIFAIEELYNYHKDYIAEIIQKSIIYGKNGVSDIYAKHPHLFKDEKDAGRFLLGNYVDENEIHKRPLSKITIDIATEFGML